MYTPHSLRTLSHAYFFSCVWLRFLQHTLLDSLCAISQKQSSFISQAMFGTLLDAPSTALTRGTCTSPSLLFPSSWAPSVTSLFGRFAQRSRLTPQTQNRIRFVIIGILPCVNIAKLNRHANSMKSAFSCTKTLTVRLTRSRAQWWTSFCCLTAKLCVSGCGAAEIQVDFSKGHKILWIKAHHAIPRGHISPRKKSGSKGSIPRCYSAF